MRIRLAVYLGLVLALGTGLLLREWTRPAAWPSELPLLTALFWFMLSLASEALWLETPTRSGMISMSLAVNVATLYILPPAPALTILFLSVWMADLLLHRRGLLKAVFNGLQTALSGGALLGILWIFTGSWGSAGSRLFLTEPLAVVLSLVALFVANTFIVAGVIAISSGQRFWSAWRENFGFGYQFLSSSTLSLLGLTLVMATQALGFMAGILYLLFLIFVRDAYRRYVAERTAGCVGRT